MLRFIAHRRHVPGTRVQFQQDQQDQQDQQVQARQDGFRLQSNMMRLRNAKCSGSSCVFSNGASDLQCGQLDLHCYCGQLSKFTM